MARLTTQDVAYSGLFVALMAVSAYVSIPAGSVPFTLQVLVVLVAGMVLGPRLGALSMLAYLMLGLLAPVFHGGASGLHMLLGPTGGYLWGFVLAAAAAGGLAPHDRAPVVRYIIAGLVGLIPIYVLGAMWLSIERELDLRAAIAAGVAPFIWIDIIKAVVAGLAARALVNLPLGLPALQRDR